LLQSRGLSITGLIFNGDAVPATEEVILEYTGLKCLGRIKQEENLNKEVISQYAAKFQGI